MWFSSSKGKLKWAEGCKKKELSWAPEGLAGLAEEFGGYPPLSPNARNADAAEGFHPGVTKEAGGSEKKAVVMRDLGVQKGQTP